MGPHLVLQRGHQLLTDGVGEIQWMADDMLERFDFVAYELGGPVKLALILRIGFEIPQLFFPNVLSNVRSRDVTWELTATSTIRARLLRQQYHDHSNDQ